MMFDYAALVNIRFAAFTVLLAMACGGSPPDPVAPDPSMEPVANPPEPDALPEPEVEAPPEPPAPKPVTLQKVEIEGAGLTEDVVKAAVETVMVDYEKCFSDALAEAADAGGEVTVTLLYKLGERKSVAASYAGPGLSVINRCFTEASGKMVLEPPKEDPSTTVFLELMLTKAP